VRRITVLVVAGAAGVAVGSILPLPGRTKVATPLGNGTRISAPAKPAARPPDSRVRQQTGRARRAAEIDTTSPGSGFEQFKAHTFIEADGDLVTFAQEL
jgi:hypothetical protein